MVVRHSAILGRIGSGVGDTGYRRRLLRYQGADGFTEKEGSEFEGITAMRLTRPASWSVQTLVIIRKEDL